MVECGGLENRYGRFTSIEGSNPSPSALQGKRRTGLVLLNLGPVTVPSGTSLDIQVIRAPAAVATATNADSNHQIAEWLPQADIALARDKWYMATIGLSVAIGQAFEGKLGAVVGGLAGWAWAAHRWKTHQRRG